MRRLTPLFIAFACVSTVLASWPLQVSAATPVPVQAPARPVVDVLEVDGVLDRQMSGYLSDAMTEAEAGGHTVLIQLSTPGAIDAETGHDLAQQVHDLRVPVLVWVGPPGATAQGAGAEIAIASSLPTVSPGSGLGAVEPASLLTEEAMSAAARTTLNGWAVERGRVAEPAMDTVLTAREALDAGVITELEPGRPTPGSVIEFLKQADGMTVDSGAGPVTLRTAPSAAPEEGPGVSLRYQSLGPVAGVLHAVAMPLAVWMLLVLGFAGLAFELTQPGFGFAGISGLIALSLAGYGIWSTPPSWLGLAILVIGTGLLIADVQRGRLGAVTGLGMAGWLAGSFLLYRGVAEAIAIPWWLILLVAAGVFWYYGFGLTIAQQSYRRIVNTQQGLIGMVGEARNDLNPEGAVHVKGTLWRARTVGDEIRAGTRVRVRGVDGMVLRVEAEPEDD